MAHILTKLPVLLLLVPWLLNTLVQAGAAGTHSSASSSSEFDREIRVCATPDSGFWMLKTPSERSGSVSALRDHAKMYPDQKWTGAKPPVWQGATKTDTWNLTGWYAELVTHVMLGSSVTNYSVRFLPNYASALYATTKRNLCDVSFSPFTITAARTNCKNASELDNTITGISPCTDPSHDLDVPRNSDACCAAFGTPSQAFEPVLMVTSKFSMPSVLDSLFTFDVINISSFLLCGVILAAHFVWLVERHDNPNQFPTQYLDGIDDAIWWSCATVTTVGYGDKFPITNLGRMFALLWMFSGVAFLGLFAGTISASVERTSQLRGINSMDDLQPTHSVCTPSPSYIPAFLTGSDKLFKAYTPPGESLEECVEDLVAGKCTGVFYDEPILKYFFVANGNRILNAPHPAGATMSSSYKLVRQNMKASGAMTDYLAPVFPHVRAGKRIGNTEKIASREDEHFIALLKERMNVAQVDYISSGEASKIMRSYFPETVGNDSKNEGNVEPNWMYITPCVAFIIIYWTLAGAQKYYDGEFDSWLRASGCSKCQKYKLATNLEGQTDSNSETNKSHDEQSNAFPEKQKESENKQSHLREEQDVEKQIYSTEIELAVNEDEIERHQAASLLQRSFRRRSINRLLRVPADDNLFVSREHVMSAMDSHHRGHGHGHSDHAGHNTTLYANGPEFEGLVKETHQMHRVLLSQQNSLRELSQMLEKLTQKRSTISETIGKKDEKEETENIEEEKENDMES